MKLVLNQKNVKYNDKNLNRLTKLRVNVN